MTATPEGPMAEAGPDRSGQGGAGPIGAGPIGVGPGGVGPVGPRWRLRVGRRGRGRSPASIRTGLVILVVFVAVSVSAPVLAPHDPLSTDVGDALAHPSWAHWLGTDQYGRDVLSRLVYGARASLLVAVGVVAGSLAAGMVVGLVAGFLGGWVGRILMAANDILLAFPGFLLALALVAARGSSLSSVILAIVVAYAPRVAVVMRSVVLTVRERLFIEAAHASALPGWRIIVRHVLPNSLPPIIVVGTVSAATAILAEAGLSFLGLGVQPPAPTWGNLISEGQNFLASNPWISVSGGLCIATVVIGLNLLGDGLRDSLDPRLRDTSSRIA